MNDIRKDIRFINERYEMLEKKVRHLENIKTSSGKFQSSKLLRRFKYERDRYLSVLGHLVELDTKLRHEKSRKEEVK